MSLVRGRVYEADFGGDVGAKLYLVVSNNRRNRALRSALVARLTTSLKPDLPSIVELPPGEAFNGRVLCDNITTMYETDDPRDCGGLSARTMEHVGEALKAALALE